jgi:cephalosporin hydroxylase
VTAIETDKIQTGLIEVYANLFSELRHEPVALLEIGIASGGSLLLWADFFQSKGTKIIGLDLRIPECRLPDNITMHVCDQNDSDGLARIASLHGPFDIIIDDGSHFTGETHNCFATLFPNALKLGGYYIIEDWAVGYWRGQEPRFIGMVELVADIIRDAPKLAIGALTVSLKPGQAYAAFRRQP